VVFGQEFARNRRILLSLTYPLCAGRDYLHVLGHGSVALENCEKDVQEAGSRGIGLRTVKPRSGGGICRVEGRASNKK